MYQHARTMRRIARRRIRKEYEIAEPSLRRVLGHFAVYQVAADVVEYEESLFIHGQIHTDDEDITVESHDDECEMSETVTWHDPVFVDDTPDDLSPADSDVDFLLPDDDQELLLEDSEQAMIPASTFRPPTFDITPNHEEGVLNPLRQSPSLSFTFDPSCTKTEIHTVPQLRPQRRLMVMQMAEVFFRALNKLGIKRTMLIDSGSDVEAQLPLRDVTFVMLSEKLIGCDLRFANDFTTQVVCEAVI